jgi:hypothetical protein
VKARETLQIGDGGAPPDIERVLAHTFVAGPLALDLIETGQRVLDGRPATEHGPSFGRPSRRAELLQ